MDAKSTMSDALPEYDEMLRQVLGLAPRVGGSLIRAHRNRIRELNRYLNADPLTKHFPGSYMAGLEEVCAALEATATAYHRSAMLKGIAFLISRVRADFDAAVDATLAGFNGVVLDTMRDVMEVQYLLSDFRRDPRRITGWVSADRETILKEYSPASLRRRQAAALGLRPEELPDAAEYRLHSEGLHVSPSFVLDDLAPKGFTRAPSPRGPEFAFAEIFEHGRRVLLAAHDLGVSIEGANWAGPDARVAMPEAAKAWERTRAVVEVKARFEHRERPDDTSV